MSKKHHKTQALSSSGESNAGLGHEAEYKIIKHDLIRVVALNVIYLAGVLALYYSNRQSHFLEHWFERVFNM